MKKIISLVIGLACITASEAQYVGEAIRYSQNFPTLSARSMSMGNAFASLGGDFSSTYVNPAGLGLYRKSEFVFSPALGLSNTKADYLGETNEDYKYQFNFSNLGYVGTVNTNKDKGLVSASFAMGYNRLNNFNNFSYIRGHNTQTSLIDNFMLGFDGLGIDGTDPDNLDAFSSRLAFDAYLIDTIPGSFNYDTPVLLPVDQRRTIDTKGGTGEWNFSFGLNFSNIWYIGMGLGFDQIRLKQTTTHSEFDAATDATDFDNFHYREVLDVDGNGYSVSFGTMVRLFKIMRLGASLHLPTYYRIEEAYLYDMVSEFAGGTVHDGIYADGSFRYKLSTPLRLQGGASVQFGTMGILSADLEYIDYSNMRLRERDNAYDFQSDNDAIQDVYRSVINLRAGGEIRFDNLFVRLGGGIYPSPYSSWELNKDAGYSEITAGLGYRSSSFFFDLGFSTLFHKEKYHLYSAYEYDPGNPDPAFINHIADLSQQKYRLVASLGFRF